MIDYLIQNKDIFNISGIERRLNMPVDTLRKAISGDQKLPKKWDDVLRNFLFNTMNDVTIIFHKNYYNITSKYNE
jgi:CO dehydrogenase/acetyl-CoA synthase gamma subunit (corrinoid Fe-S protein)